jgi:hypothetical protein
LAAAAYLRCAARWLQIAARSICLRRYAQRNLP